MIEIIVLIFLVIYIGKIAAKKGLKPGMWRLYTVLSWLGGEFVGVIAGLLLFGKDNIIVLMFTGIIGALGGYFILKFNLDKKPNNLDEDINRIGVDDLRP